MSFLKSVVHATWTASTASSPDLSRSRRALVRSLFRRLLQDYANTRRSYRVLAGFSIFAAAYLLVLFFQVCTNEPLRFLRFTLWTQGSHGESYEVKRSLRTAFVPGPTLRTSLASKEHLLGYVAQDVVLPIWQNMLCGDDRCQWPWEFPAFGRFGCRADCGAEQNTTRLLVQIKANFGGQPSLSPRTLMSNVGWNLCMTDLDRARRGQEELCWFAEDEGFSEVLVNRLETMEVIDGEWSIRLRGDYTHRVSGRIFDISDETNPIEIYPTVRPYIQRWLKTPSVASMEWMYNTKEQRRSVEHCFSKIKGHDPSAQKKIEERERHSDRQSPPPKQF